MIGLDIALPKRLKIACVAHIRAPDNLAASPEVSLPDIKARSIRLVHFVTLSSEGQDVDANSQDD